MITAENNMDKLQNRIIEYKRVRAGDLVTNERNFREHPLNQKEALDGVLAVIGQADSLIAYYSKRNDGKLTLIDGHLRKDFDPDQEWNVQITDLTDEEADLLISMLDPIAGMATMDAEKFLALSEEIVTDDWRVREALHKLSKEAEATLREQEAENEEDGEETGDGPADMEILPFEHYDYIMIFFKNQLDWLAAQEYLGLEKRHDPRRTNRIGLSHVIDGGKFVNFLRSKEKQAKEPEQAGG
jgi:hypothetical protein